jgi:hypothetical protein
LPKRDKWKALGPLLSKFRKEPIPKREKWKALGPLLSKLPIEPIIEKIQTTS